MGLDFNIGIFGRHKHSAHSVCKVNEKGDAQVGCVWVPDWAGLYLIRVSDVDSRGDILQISVGGEDVAYAKCVMPNEINCSYGNSNSSPSSQFDLLVKALQTHKLIMFSKYGTAFVICRWINIQNCPIKSETNIQLHGITIFI